MSSIVVYGALVLRNLDSVALKGTGAFTFAATPMPRTVEMILAEVHNASVWTALQLAFLSYVICVVGDHRKQ